MVRYRLRLLQGWLLLGVVIASVSTAVGLETRPLVLEHLTTQEGLPQGTVYASLQDSAGFVWFGTEDGLVRYDGHDVVRYAAGKSGKSNLPGNFVFGIVEDHRSDLWIALKGAGVAQWHRNTDTFTVYRHDEANPASLSSDFVRTLQVDSKGFVWIGTLDSGVDVLDPGSGRILHLRHREGQSQALVNDQVYSLFEDKRGEMWIGTHAGIDRWRLREGVLTRSPYMNEIPSLLPREDVQQIIDGDDGTVWAATFADGVFHLDYSGRVIANIRHLADDRYSIGNDEVHALLKDHVGRLWIGTAGGLDAWNIATGRSEHYEHDKADAASLTDSFIMSLYEDSSGLIWIGTRSGGVNRWNSRSWLMGASNPSWLEGRSVTAFADSTDGKLWVGTLGGGLYDLDLNSGEAEKLDHLLGKDNVLSDSRVMSLMRDRHGALWIGTWGQGLKILGSDRQLTSIPVKPGDDHALSASGIATIYEAGNGLVWVGTHGGGANIVDPVTLHVRQVPFTRSVSGTASTQNVTAFAEDRDGNMWIGTDGGGVSIADADGRVFASFRRDSHDQGSLSSDVIYAITVDDAGKVWIATDGGGLNLVVGSSLTPGTLRFDNFSQAEGLSGDTIYSAVPDAQGQLWLSGNAGLMRFDPATHAVKTFHREHGLQGEEFNSGAYHRMSDGRVCFGGPSGINVFDPAAISSQTQPPRIVMTGMEVLGAPVHGTIPYWDLHDVHLDYTASVVSFDFAALDFKSPGRNRLAYRVSGLTDRWIDLNSQKRVTLTNLGAGEHVLEVRGANADSSWSTVPYRLVIRKSAAPWLSPAAFAIYALLLTATIGAAWRRQRRKLRLALTAKLHLESEVALRTEELSEANRQLIVASEAKSDFLARMGHELRTPMNGVVGMAELLSRASLPSAQSRQVETVLSSARTLLQILNDLLDLSKAQAGKIELESLPIDMTRLIEESVALFTAAADAKGLYLLVHPASADNYIVHGDPLRIRQILLNLIGNAIKFTERGEVIVTWDMVADEAGSSVRLSVSDTGVGIHSTAIARIFDPFAQADETTTRRFGGTGLGLSICRELAELMGGTIRVDSNPNNGSVFTVSLPLRIVRQEAVSGAGIVRPICVLVSRRIAVAESLRRYAALLGWECRMSEPSSVDTLPEDYPIILDADSYPTAVSRLTRGRYRSRIIIAASAATIKSRDLEHTVADTQLLPMPAPRAMIRSALAHVSGQSGATTRIRPPGEVLHCRLSVHALIVEDDDVNATVAEGYLSALGCTSVRVADGETAIARIAIERFDIVLMDLNMPGLDGFETSRRIRAAEGRPQRVPIIALTANSADAYRKDCIAAGMDDILTKPYTLRECLDVLSRWTVGHDGAAPTAAAVDVAPAPGLADIDRGSVAALQGISSSTSANLYERLVSMFEKSSSESMAAIAAAIDRNDWAAARAAAHKLKGASANVGALAFSSALGLLEASCLGGEASEIRGLGTQIAGAYPVLLNALRSAVEREPA